VAIRSVREKKRIAKEDLAARAGHRTGHSSDSAPSKEWVRSSGQRAPLVTAAKKNRIRAIGPGDRIVKLYSPKSRVTPAQARGFREDSDSCMSERAGLPS